jgi:hypothetical protein
VLVKAVRVLLLLMAFLVLLPSQVEALGVGVAPHKLELEAYPLGSTTSSINVVNTSDEKSRYQVYVEGEGKVWFSIAPEEFVLDPQSSQEVKIAVSPSLTASGEHEATISVVSLAPASELGVGVGVKIPVRIHIVSPPPLAMLGIDVTGPLLLVIISIAALLPVALVAGTFIWRRRKADEAD